MEARYEILLTIYDIVKSDPSPETYLVTPHDVILRQTIDWVSIEKQLEVLATEQLITIKQLGKMAICIMPAGVAKAKNLKNNFISQEFFLPNDKNATAKIIK